MPSSPASSPARKSSRLLPSALLPESSSTIPDPVPDSTRLLAIHITRERDGIVLIGAGLLDPEQDRLSILGRTVAWIGDAPFLLQMLLDVASPVAKVIMSSKADEWITDSVRSTLKDSGMGELVIQTSASFDFENSVARFRNALDPAKTQTLGSLMDLGNRASIGAVGGVLVAAAKATGNLGACSRVDMFDLGSFMLLDAASTRALDIARLEEHPSVIRGRGRPKEGFSLLTLLNRAKSSLGSSLLRRWVSRPLNTLSSIAARHDAIAALLTNLGLCATLSKAFKGVHDLPRALLHIKACTAHARDWIILAESVASIEVVLRTLGTELDATSPAFLIDIANAATPDLTDVGKLLDIVDWEETRAVGRVVPRVGADGQLDAARRRLAGLESVLESETLSLRGSSNNHWTMRCIPTLGFVVAVRAGDDEPLPPDFEHLFEASSVLRDDDDDGSHRPTVVTRYFKNSRARQLDAIMGDIAGSVFDHEQRVMRTIEARVVELESALLLAAHRAAELDAILSLTEVARDFDYCRPVMCSEPVTCLIEAVHPLLSRTVERFIPLDIELGGDGDGKSPVLCITGPNFSGKSVVLKTVAMIHIMAQIGSYVPCKAARLGLVDRIFTRVSSLESVSQTGVQDESSFSIDVQQVALMLNACTPNSLLIVDEFGKGTQTHDGAALLGAVLHHLLEQGPSTPRSLITTHLAEIFDAKLVECRLAEMKVEFDEDKNAPQPMFRLAAAEQATGESYGIACARRSLVPETVLERATELAERLTLKLPLELSRVKTQSASSVVRKCLKVADWGLVDDQVVAELMEDVERVVVGWGGEI